MEDRVLVFLAFLAALGMYGLVGGQALESLVTALGGALAMTLRAPQPKA